MPLTGSVPLLTTKEVAERLRMHRNTIYRMKKLGQLKGYHIRGHLCFRRTEIEQLLGHRRMARELLTVKEVADLLLVRPSTIHRMVREGRLKPYRFEGHLWFRGEDIYAISGR